MKDRFRFVIIFFIYLLAAAVGVGIAVILPLDLWLSILIADIAATIVVFVFSLIFKNASVYDPYWSVQPIVIVIGLACTSDKLTLALILPLVAIIIWGLRLTANWAYVFFGLDPKYQDWRYTHFQETTGKLYPIVNFCGIHLVPTLIVYACMLPVIFVQNAPDFNIGSIIFFVFSLLAVFLEGLADCTKHAFRAHGGKGFIRKGIWKYSRHPNYLGEISFWWGIALAVVCVLPAYWWTLIGATLNTLMFLFISIPLADGHQSRKDGFSDYKRNTRMLFPIYKKQV